MALAALLLAPALLPGRPALLPGRPAHPALGRAAAPQMRGPARYEDDGTRLKGVSFTDDVDSGLKKGLFSGFKWGKEVEVVPQEKVKATPRKPRSDMDRGLTGGTSYRNTESARLSDADPGQRIRKAKLEAYIYSEEEPTSGLVPKIISGAALFSIFAGLIGIVAYYGTDGLIAATQRM